MTNNSNTSTGVAIIGHGCGVSQYPQFYDQHLEKYQLLPRPYLGSFEGYIGEKTTKANFILDLEGEALIFV